MKKNELSSVGAEWSHSRMTEKGSSGLTEFGLNTKTTLDWLCPEVSETKWPKKSVILKFKLNLFSLIN